MKEFLSNVLFLFAVASFISVLVYGGYNSYRIQRQSEKNCEALTRVIAFKGHSGEIKSVCVDADGKYVIKP